MLVQFDPLAVPAVKKLKFLKSKMAAAAILKNLKIAISRLRYDRFWRNLGTMMQFDPVNRPEG